MRNLEYVFCTLVGISSIPNTLLAGQAQPRKKPINKQQPNIILIVADDLGYGDLSCYGAHRISTPGMDRIANEGIRFAQGFCTAATSTPSRYSVMTGLYPWTSKDAKILPGNAALIIDTEKITLPKLMKQAGYATGSIGKWHIGLGDGNVDWNKDVHPGAAEIGYDYSFIQAATNDRVPCVFLENGRVVGLDPNDPLYVDYRKNFPGEPTGKNNPELLRMHPSVGHAGSIVNGVPRIGFQKGGKAAQWKDEEMAELFLDKAKQFVNDHKNAPFFLYYGLHQPHVPRVPNERFAGKSPMGPRGDAILEADWCVSEFLKELDQLGLAENTIVVLTSDNGPVLDDGEKRAQIEEMSMQANTEVVLYGMQPMERISDIMQQYDVLILPSKHDGWGAVVNEALILGLYVITSNHCGASYLLKDKQQGMIFTLEEAQSLSNVADVCIAKKDWIRETVNERITWSKNYISGKAVANYIVQNL